jgi:hypothetical protein
MGILTTLFALVPIAAAVDAYLKPTAKRALAERALRFSNIESRAPFSNSLDRLFGPSILSLRSFSVSAIIVGISILLLATGTYIFSSGGRAAFELIIDNMSLFQLFSLLVITIFVIVGDFFSYAQTRLFIRETENSKNVFSVFVFVVSDIITSLFLFTVFFSLALTAIFYCFAQTQDISLSLDQRKVSPPIIDNVLRATLESGVGESDENRATMDELYSRVLTKHSLGRIISNDWNIAEGEPEEEALIAAYLSRAPDPYISDTYTHFMLEFASQSSHINWKFECSSEEENVFLSNPFQQQIFGAVFLVSATLRAELSNPGLTAQEKIFLDKAQRSITSLTLHDALGDDINQLDGVSCIDTIHVDITTDGQALVKTISSGNLLLTHMQITGMNLFRSMTLKFSQYTMGNTGNSLYKNIQDAQYTGATWAGDTNRLVDTQKATEELLRYANGNGENLRDNYMPVSTFSLTSLVPSAVFFILLIVRAIVYLSQISSFFLRGVLASFEIEKAPVTIFTINLLMLYLATSLVAQLLF